MGERATELIEAGLPLEPIRATNRLVIADLLGAWDDLARLADGLVDLEPRLRHFPPLFRVVAHLGQGTGDAATEAATEAVVAARPVEPAAGTGWALALPSVWYLGLLWICILLGFVIVDATAGPGRVAHSCSAITSRKLPHAR